MKWLYYIFSHSFFVAFCAVALSLQSCQFLQIQVSASLSFFIFFATINAYNFYWFFSKYNFDEIRGQLNPILKENALSVFLFISSLVYIVVFLIVNQHLLGVTTISFLLSIIYALPIILKQLAKRLQAFGFLKTILLAFTWAFVTVVLPVQFSGIYHSNTVLLLLLHRFLFMFLLCIIFDARDAKIDAIKNLHSIATFVNTKILHIIFCSALIAFLVLSNTINLSLLQSKFNFVTWFISSVVLVLYYLSARKKRGYFYYYFLVDGCMILYPLLTYLVSI